MDAWVIPKYLDASIVIRWDARHGQAWCHPQGFQPGPPCPVGVLVVMAHASPALRCVNAFLLHKKINKQINTNNFQKLGNQNKTKHYITLTS